MTEIKDIIQEAVATVDTVESDREKLDAVNDAISKIRWEINTTQYEIKKWTESLQIIMGKLWNWNTEVIGQSVWFDDIDMSVLNDEHITDLKDAKSELHLDAILLFRELSFLYQNNQNPDVFLLYEKRLNDTQWRNDRKEYIKKLNELPDKIIWAYPNPASNTINITIDYSLVGAWYQAYMDVIRPFRPPEGTDSVSFNVLPPSTTINPLQNLPIIEQNWYSSSPDEHIMSDYEDWSTTFNEEFGSHYNTEQQNIVVEWSINIVSINWQPVLTPVQFKIDQATDQSYAVDLSNLLPWTYIITIPEIMVFWKPLTKKIIKQ